MVKNVDNIPKDSEQFDPFLDIDSETETKTGQEDETKEDEDALYRPVVVKHIQSPSSPVTNIWSWDRKKFWRP